MARIRSIKPEFWTDEKLTECSLSARLLFIGLWNFADDSGRMEYSPKRIKMQIFPADDINQATITEWVGELNEHSLIRLYVVDGKEYLSIPNFAKHQKINRPTPSKLPDSSGSAHGGLSEHSPTEKEKEKEFISCSSGDERFADFWSIYPRKVGKDKALAAWKRKKLDAIADQIIEHVQIRIRRDRQWLEDQKYIPHPTTFLNRGGWKDEYEVAERPRIQGI